MKSYVRLVGLGKTKSVKFKPDLSMKKFVTVLFSLALLGYCGQASFGQQASHVVRVSKAGITTAAVGAPASESNSVVFEQANKGTWPLLAFEQLSYFADTTGGNWFFYPADFDSTGPIKVRYPDGSIRDTNVTLFYKGVGERFTTNLKTAYLDSVQMTFLPINMGPNDHMYFFVRPVNSFQPTDGSQPFPVVDFFNQNSPVPITKQVIYSGALTMNALNTISVKFNHLSLSAKNHNFAIVAQPMGPGIATDTIFYQLDAALSDYQPTWAIDSDQSRSYIMRYDSAAQIAGNGPLGDLQQVQGGTLTGQAYFGNLIMNAYLSGVAAGVDQAGHPINSIDQNFPNPVSGKSSIAYSLGSTGPVSIRVYNELGNLVSTLVENEQSSGDHAATFNAANLPNGTYYYKIQAGSYSDTKMMIVSH